MSQCSMACLAFYLTFLFPRYSDIFSDIIISKRCTQDFKIEAFRFHLPSINPPFLHFPRDGPPRRSMVSLTVPPRAPRRGQHGTYKQLSRKTGSFTNIKSRVPQFLNFHVHCAYIYIYAARNPASHFLIQGILIQCLDRR